MNAAVLFGAIVLVAIATSWLTKTWERWRRARQFQHRESSEEMRNFALAAADKKYSEAQVEEVLSIIERELHVPLEKLRPGDEINCLYGLPKWFGIPMDSDVEECLFQLYDLKRRRLSGSEVSLLDGAPTLGALISLALD